MAEVPDNAIEREETTAQSMVFPIPCEILDADESFDLSDAEDREAAAKRFGDDVVQRCVRRSVTSYPRFQTNL